MEKKGKLYFLILINLISWGYVGYRVYSAIKGEDDLSLVAQDTSFDKIESIYSKDSIHLKLDYPDPFLKTGKFNAVKSENITEAISRKSLHSNQNISNNKEKKKNINSGLNIQSQPKEMKYLGLLSNSDKGTKTALLSVNSKTSIVKIGDLIEGYTVNFISSSELILVKNKEKLVISK